MKSYILNITLIFSFLLLAACHSEENSSPRKAPFKAAILIDKTTYEKDPSAVERELKTVAEELLKKMQNGNEKEFLGSFIELGFIDDSGEHESLWELKFAEKLGKRKSLFRQSLITFQQKITRTFEGLRNDKKIHQESWIVEPIVKELKKLNEGDDLYVISDLMIVDGVSNFERMIFAPPVDLSKYAGGKNVSLRRISLGKKRFEEIAAIEAWWQSAISGDQQFFKIAYSRIENLEDKKIAVLQNESNRTSPIKAKGHLTRTKLAKMPSKKSFLNNEIRLVFEQNKEEFHNCYMETSSSAHLIGLKLKLDTDGTVSDVAFVGHDKDSELALKGCIQTVLMGLKFPVKQNGEKIIRETLRFAQM